MNFLKFIYLFIFGISSGLVVAGGVFSTLIALGLVPRFAGRSRTAHKVMLYEDFIIMGCILGILISVWPFGEWILRLREMLSAPFLKTMNAIGEVLLGTGGFFAGCFVGCMALAIAEMLDGIPIFARRISFRKGLGCAIFAVAIAKLLGSLFYFIKMM